MDKNRVCAKINLDAILYNMEQMHKNLNDDTQMMAVIKTDGYGHGAVTIAKTLESVSYVYGYAVATIDEAIELRKAHINKPILILGYTFPDSYEDLIRYQIRPTIFSYEMAKAISECAEHRNQTLPIHIKIDTGMSRIGYQVSEENADEISRIHELPNLVCEGIFTHFSKADYANKSDSRKQFQEFLTMISYLEDRKVIFKIHHCANSAAILEYPESKLDMVRAGITMYGLWPSDEMNHDFPLKPALSLYSHISFIKKINKGTAVSYGGTFIAPCDMTIATVPVGYGDGYSRGLSNKGYVLIHGQKAPILGRICMDQFMVDVSDILQTTIHDEVVLIGQSQQETITVEELGELSERFNYEFVCDLGNRIPRLYYRNNQLVDTKEYL